MNRKDFFRHSGRWAVLSLLGISSAVLVYQHKIETPDKCTVTTQCKSCGKYAQCTLPQATKIKQYGKES